MKVIYILFFQLVLSHQTIRMEISMKEVMIKDEFIKLLSYDIEKTAESLFSDKPIAEEFGLLWHKNLHGTNDMQINIKIK